MPSLVAKPRQSRLIETAVEFLSTCVIFRRPDVDEHSTLLKCIYAMIEYARKNILLEASGPLRNILENGAVKDVYTAVYQARSLIPHFFPKANHSPVRVHLTGSIPASLPHLAVRP